MISSKYTILAFYISKQYCYILFNATGSTELKEYETDNEPKVLDYLKSICPDTDFPKGKLFNDIMRRTNRNER